MKVHELVSLLQKCDQDLQVYTCFDSMVCQSKMRADKLFIVSGDPKHDQYHQDTGVFIGANVDADEAKMCLSGWGDQITITRPDGLPLDHYAEDDDE